MDSVISKILEILVSIVFVVTFGLFTMSFVGCLLLLRPLLKRSPRLHHFRAASDSPVPEKRKLTKYERYIGVLKIREFGRANLKKILTSKINPTLMILLTISLIVLTVLFWLLAAMMELGK